MHNLFYLNQLLYVSKSHFNPDVNSVCPVHRYCTLRMYNLKGDIWYLWAVLGVTETHWWQLLLYALYTPWNFFLYVMCSCIWFFASCIIFSIMYIQWHRPISVAIQRCITGIIDTNWLKRYNSCFSTTSVLIACQPFIWIRCIYMTCMHIWLKFVCDK